MKSLVAVISILTVVVTHQVAAEEYHIKGTFDGCNYGKLYQLTTRGKFLRCDEYQYFYSYSPEVITDDERVIVVDDNRLNATIVNGTIVTTNISGDWEGCDFDDHRLMNGWILTCSTFFFEYSYAPLVEIIIINSLARSVSINGTIRENVSVVPLTQ
jgi:hypothetical protein